MPSIALRSEGRPERPLFTMYPVRFKTIHIPVDRDDRPYRKVPDVYAGRTGWGRTAETSVVYGLSGALQNDLHSGRSGRSTLPPHDVALILEHLPRPSNAAVCSE